MSTPYRMTLTERLNSGLMARANGCIEWTGTTSPKGYGHIKINGTPRRTHRVAWELAHGPIPEGVQVLHHCDNPPCAQTKPTDGYPDGHLFLGTNAENMADRDAKGRGWNQGKTHCLRGHLFDEANTYMWRGRRQCRTCNKAREQARAPRPYVRRAVAA